jgi:serine/threonine protein phosphatase PrpC
MIMGMQSFGESNVGRRRGLNEDSLFFDDGLGLYIVADGMGGQNAGEIASRTAVDVVTTFIRRSNKSNEMTWPFGIVAHLSYNGNRLRTAVMLANKHVWRDAETRQEFVGMGTTIVAALVENAVLTLCSAGDSRAYRIRQNQLEQITTDDSWVQAAFSAGALNPERFQDHPLRSIVTKAVGAKETIDVDILEAPIQEGDLYLLCSDGLHGMIEDSKILEIVLATDGNLQKTVADLIAAANASGGKDNITALLLRHRSA